MAAAGVAGGRRNRSHARDGHLTNEKRHQAPADRAVAGVPQGGRNAVAWDTHRARHEGGDRGGGGAGAPGRRKAKFPGGGSITHKRGAPQTKRRTRGGRRVGRLAMVPSHCQRQTRGVQDTPIGLSAGDGRGAEGAPSVPALPQCHRPGAAEPTNNASVPEAQSSDPTRVGRSDERGSVERRWSGERAPQQTQPSLSGWSEAAATLHPDVCQVRGASCRQEGTKNDHPGGGRTPGTTAGRGGCQRRCRRAQRHSVGGRRALPSRRVGAFGGGRGTADRRSTPSLQKHTRGCGAVLGP